MIWQVLFFSSFLLLLVVTFLCIIQGKRTAQSITKKESLKEKSGLYYYDKKSHCFRGSPAWAEVLDMETPLSLDISELERNIHKEDQFLFHSLYQDGGLLPNQSAFIEYRIVNPQNQENWFRDRILSLEKDKKGNPAFLLIYSENIQQQKKTFQRLKKENSWIKAMAEALQTPYLVLDNAFNVQHASMDMKQLSGFSLSWLKEKNISTVFPFLSEALNQYQKKMPCDQTSTILGESCFWQEGQQKKRHYRILIQKSNKSYILFFNDISELKKKEEALKKELLYRGLVMDLMPIGLAILSGFDLLECNKRFFDIHGYSKEELLSSKSSLFLEPEERQRAMRLFQQAQMERKGFTEEFNGRHKEGKELRLLVSILPMPPAIEGDFMIGIMDISNQKLMEEQLQKAKKMETLGQLAGGVAHDFNNLLAGIIGYSEILLLPEADPNMKKNYLQKIISTANNAGKMINQLLSYSRKKEDSFEIINIHQIIKECIDILYRSIDKKIEIKSNLKAKNDTIHGDPVLFQNILLNIAVNARDAMPSGGIIRFETENLVIPAEQTPREETAPLNLQLTISDTGIGIKEENLEKIFDPFFTTKGQGKGTGLGLAAARETIQKHNGTIQVESTPGVGSHFIINLPVYSEGQPKTAEEKNKNTLLNKQTVLIVDDEDFIRDILKQHLGKNGFEVLTAKDGMEGLNVFLKHQSQLDLIFIDMIMPKLSGEEFFNMIHNISLQQQWKHFKIILLSGYAKNNEIAELLEKGAAAFLKKPFSKDELFQTIYQVQKELEDQPPG